MSSKFSKIVGASALGALSTLDLMYSQQAIAVSTFSGSTVANPHGGSVQVSITVDGASGTYRITGISTPVQPTGANAAYSNLAIPTLTSEALAAQSASITAVSGASQISAAWISSLSAAIASAAAGGQRVGAVSIVATPTPTPTPSSVATTPAAGGGTTPVPVSTTPAQTPNSSSTTPTGPGANYVPTQIMTAAGGEPIFTPLTFIPYTSILNVTTSLSGYSNEIAAALALLPTTVTSNSINAINSARTTLRGVQSQMQAAGNQIVSAPPGLTEYLNYANNQLSYVYQQTNQAYADYMKKVQDTANQFALEAQKSIDQKLAEAQSSADKLVADAKAQADKIVAEAQAKADAIKASPAPTVTITATPKPQALTIALKPGAVIQKSFSCTKLYLGKPVTITVKDISMKCPSGYSLSKKI